MRHRTKQLQIAQHHAAWYTSARNLAGLNVFACGKTQTVLDSVIQLLARLDPTGEGEGPMSTPGREHIIIGDKGRGMTGGEWKGEMGMGEGEMEEGGIGMGEGEMKGTVRGAIKGDGMHQRGGDCKSNGKARWGYLEVPAPGVQLAGSAVPEGVEVQLPIEARHDRVAGGAVSVVKAVIGMQG